jgi:IS30 family transposase
MRYHQITPEERYAIAALRMQQPRPSNAAIARILGRHPSTISREVRRNRARHDGAYRAQKAQEKTNGRRSRSRRWRKHTACDWMLVESLLRDKYSPEQISGRLRLEGALEISYETIYKYIWDEKDAGGQLYRHLRQPIKRRKGYGTYERRGRVLGKRHISQRPAAVEARCELGHWELDTVHGTGSRDAIVTVVERATGVVLIGKIPDLTAASLNKRLLHLMRRFDPNQDGLFKTITSDNGTEFHSYEEIEKATGVEVFFATPYHSWERGTNENTNGLIRQYLPKRTSMTGLTQTRCNAIANKLNTRPRKRYGFSTPLERLAKIRT